MKRHIGCAAVSDLLLTSELFGHVAGAFTGSVLDRLGRLELAHGGTVFLYEIETVSPTLQQRLLRLLERHEIERLGEQSPRPVNVRVMAATQTDLRTAVTNGTFREDLFYRLNVVPIHLPPLRERREDIPLLVPQLLDTLRARTGHPITQVSKDAFHTLTNYDWPGNLRELEAVLEYAAVSCTTTVIDVRDLPPELHALGTMN